MLNQKMEEYYITYYKGFALKFQGERMDIISGDVIIKSVLGTGWHDTLQKSKHYIGNNIVAHTGVKPWLEQ